MKTKRVILHSCLILFLSSCFNNNKGNSENINNDTKSNSTNTDKESILLMYQNIRKITDKYSTNSTWHYATKKKENWEIDTTFNTIFSIDISTEPRIGIFFSIDKELLVSDVKSYLNKGDTIIFNVSNIHYEQQTLIFYPVDSIKKIVQWNTIENGDIKSLGNFIDFPNRNN